MTTKRPQVKQVAVAAASTGTLAVMANTGALSHPIPPNSLIQPLMIGILALVAGAAVLKRNQRRIAVEHHHATLSLELQIAELAWEAAVNDLEPYCAAAVKLIRHGWAACENVWEPHGLGRVIREKGFAVDTIGPRLVAGHPDFPMFGFEWKPFGARVYLDPAPGYNSPSRWKAEIEALANTFNLPDARLNNVKAGVIELDLITTDILEDAVPLPTPEENPNLQKLRVGICDDGEDFRQQIRGAHLLIAGLTGAGKSSGIWSLVAAMAPAIRDGLVHLHAIDLKRGMELALGGPLYRTFAYDIDTTIKTLEKLVAILQTRADDSRYKGLRGIPDRKHQPTVDDPHHVLIIDEIMALLVIYKNQLIPVINADGEEVQVKLGVYASALLIELLTQARAVGITVVMATQNASKEVFGMIRDLATEIAGMRLASDQQQLMVFGSGATERGVRATEIDPRTPGIIYVLKEGAFAAERARYFFVTDKDILWLRANYEAPEHIDIPDDLPEPDPDMYITPTGDRVDTSAYLAIERGEVDLDAEDDDADGDGAEILNFATRHRPMTTTKPAPQEATISDTNQELDENTRCARPGCRNPRKARKGALYCSPACKTQHHRLKQARNAQGKPDTE